MDFDLMTIISTFFVIATLYALFKRFTSPSSSPPPSSSRDVKLSGSEKAEVEDEDEGNKKPLKIFYGSQTGTAEDFANTLSDEGMAYGFAPEVIDLEEFDMDDMIDTELALFCMATYGEGEPTDNARNFWTWMKEEEHEDDTLANMKFSVFGLGNKTYEHYNLMGKETDKLLAKMGAERMFELGLGDDDASLEEDFEKWKRDLWSSVCNAAGMEMIEPLNIKKQRRYEMTTYDRIPEKVTSHHFQTDFKSETEGSYLVPTKPLLSANHKSYKMYDAKNPYLGKVITHRELHSPNSDRSCLHIEIELIKNSYLRYQPGDHLGVFAENDAEIVNYVAQRLGADLDAVVKLSPAGKSKATPLGPFTVRRALTSFADLTAKPRQSYLREIAQYCEDDEEKARLLLLGDASNDNSVAQYQHYIIKDYRSIVDILVEFPSLCPPLDIFLELTPRLDPRFYSISSARDDKPLVVSLTAVVSTANKKGGLKGLYTGVCTGWLAKLQNRVDDVVVPCFMRKSEFKLPKDPSIPIIMVGPGTGIAPFRGFLQWRKHNRDNLGDAVLFFGCRSAKLDYLYGDELQAAVDEGYLTTLITAFSRDQSEKIYVQHRLMEHAEMIYNQYLKKGAIIYICGDATYMAKDVNTCFKQMLMKYEAVEEARAEEMLSEMRKNHRYQEDVWHS